MRQQNHGAGRGASQLTIDNPEGADFWVCCRDEYFSSPSCRIGRSLVCLSSLDPLVLWLGGGDGLGTGLLEM